MTPENTKKLVSVAPSLFPGGEFYFECGDGWFDLLKECISSIDKICERENLTEVSVRQAKEKYGALRFYVYETSYLIEDVIMEAEEKSFHTCEICGAEGRMTKECGWFCVRCEDCDLGNIAKEHNALAKLFLR